MIMLMCLGARARAQSQQLSFDNGAGMHRVRAPTRSHARTAAAAYAPGTHLLVSQMHSESLVHAFAVARSEQCSAHSFALFQRDLGLAQRMLNCDGFLSFFFFLRSKKKAQATAAPIRCGPPVAFTNSLFIELLVAAIASDRDLHRAAGAQGGQTRRS